MAGILRSKAAIVAIAVLVLATLVGVTIARWQDAPENKEQPTTGDAVEGGDDDPAQLDGWRRPVTTDPKAYASAYATAIWTYDTNRHGYSDWVDAVKVFADPMDRGTSQVAANMLPYISQWEQLGLHGASATVSEVTAETSPELLRLTNDPRTPAGWHGFVIRGRQTNVIDGQEREARRSVTVSVLCTPQCRFWSATTEDPV